MENKINFWKSFIRAVEAEPKDVQSIKGASGFDHPVVSLGVDESRRRIVIISGESNARVTAMAHADIQAAVPSVKVVMARPAPVNLGKAATILSEMLGSTSFRISDFFDKSVNGEEFQKKVNERVGVFVEKISPFLKAVNFAQLNLVTVMKEIIHQASLIDMVHEHEENQTQSPKKGLDGATLSIHKLMALDPAEVDRKMGVCSIPLYSFSGEEAEIFHSGKDIGHIRDILKNHHVFQYFFPAADHLALGLIDTTKLGVGDIINQLQQVPGLGHPFGKHELIPKNVNLTELISELHNQKLLVEGDIGIELSNMGQETRASVRFKPREGLLSKISKIFSLKIDLDLKTLLK